MTGRKNVPQTIAGNIAALAKGGRRCIAIDAPHGVDGEVEAHDSIAQAHSIERQRAAGFIAALDARGVERADVVGNSEGGLSAILAAIQYPERVRNLVLVNPAGMIGKDSILKLGWRYQKHRKQERGEWKRHKHIDATFEHQNPDKKSENAETRSIAGADVAHLLREIKQTGHGVIIVHTADDLLFPSLRMNRRISAQKSHGESVDDLTANVIDGYYTLSGSHNEYLFQPEKVMYAANHGLSALEKKREAINVAPEENPEIESEENAGKTYVSTGPENRNVWEGFGKRRYHHNVRNKAFIPDRPMSPFEQDYYERREREQRSSLLERQFAPPTRQTVVEGKSNPSKYESFSISKIEATKDDVIWICFPGLGAAYEENDIRRTLGTQTLFKKFSEAASDFLGVPGVLDSLPREGTLYAFHGPGGIAGYTPEQCIKCTEEVKKAVDDIIEQHPTAKVKFFSYSAGTHLGYFAANQYGKERFESGALDDDFAANDFIAIAAGTNIGYGMYSTWVVEPLAQDMEKRGITKQQYFEQIRPYTQIENLEFLPKKDKCKMFAGTSDSFIPIDMEGGTNDLVKAMDKAGLSPMYTVFEGRDHVSLMADIIFQMQRGMNPYRLGEKINALEIPGTLQDQTYMGMANRFLDNFTDAQLRGVGEILAGRNGDQGVGPYESNTILKPYETAMVKLLIDRGICAFTPKKSLAEGVYEGEPVELVVVGAVERRGGNFITRRRERILSDRNFAQIAAYLQELGRSEDLDPAVLDSIAAAA